MMNMKRTDGKNIEFKGHAESNIVCAMVTYASVALTKTLTEFLREEGVRYKIDDGYFFLDISDLSDEAMMFVNAFWHNMRQLAIDYPNSFKIYREYSFASKA